MKTCLRTIDNSLKSRVPNFGPNNPLTSLQKAKLFRKSFFENTTFTYFKVLKMLSRHFEIWNRNMHSRSASEGDAKQLESFSGLQRICSPCLLFTGTRCKTCRPVQRKDNAGIEQGSSTETFLLLTRTNRRRLSLKLRKRLQCFEE